MVDSTFKCNRIVEQYGGMFEFTFGAKSFGFPFPFPFGKRTKGKGLAHVKPSPQPSPCTLPTGEGDKNYDQIDGIFKQTAVALPN